MPKSVSTIDYGCDQGIAEMVLSDYIASKWIDNNFVKDFTLIEPSRENLPQAVENEKSHTVAKYIYMPVCIMVHIILWFKLRAYGIRWGSFPLYI